MRKALVIMLAAAGLTVPAQAAQAGAAHAGVAQAGVAQAGAALAGAAKAGQTGAAQAGQASACSIQPYGLIGDYWQALGGENAIIGCATDVERGVPNRHGRRQSFDDGQIAWSPDQGRGMIVAAYAAKVGGRNGIVFRWGPTDPFHYDYFQVLVRGTGGYWDLVVVKNQPRTRGRVVVHPGKGRRVTITVRGCDDKLVNDTCYQGDTISVSAVSP